MIPYAPRHAPPPECHSRSPSPCAAATSPRGGVVGPGPGPATPGGSAACAGVLQRGAEKLLAEGFGACVERLESQAGALEAQVVQAVRSVGLLHDVVGALEARVALLELRCLPAGPPGGGLGAGFGVGPPPQRGGGGGGELGACAAVPGLPAAGGSAAEPCGMPPPPEGGGPGPGAASSDPGFSRWEPLHGVDERLRQRFSELREWQEDVEDAVRQLSAEARAGGSAGDFTFEESTAAAWGASAEAEGPGSDAGEQRLHELAQRTESRLAQLEEHLLALRGELAASAGSGPGVAGGTGSVAARATRESASQRSADDGSSSATTAEAWARPPSPAPREGRGPSASRRGGGSVPPASRPASPAPGGGGAAEGGHAGAPSRLRGEGAELAGHARRERSSVSRLFDELVRLEKASGGERSLRHGRGGGTGAGAGGAVGRSTSATGRRSSSAHGGAPGPVRARRR